jgi:hypothetical protein
MAIGASPVGGRPPLGRARVAGQVDEERLLCEQDRDQVPSSQSRAICSPAGMWGDHGRESVEVLIPGNRKGPVDFAYMGREPLR